MDASALAMQQFTSALEAPYRPGQSLTSWRWTVRQKMTAVRDVLVAETAAHDNAWLVARGANVLRERNALLTRLGELGPMVLEEPDLEVLRDVLRRFAQDLDHHLQRISDLAYDEVMMEIGGSE